MIRNHNHLLGSVAGVDGIKTGYIHASGFNIVTSVHRNNRHIIAVVFGGHTAEARDARVRSLIDNNINVASAKRTAPPVVEGWAVAEARKDAAEKAAKEGRGGNAAADGGATRPRLHRSDQAQSGEDIHRAARRRRIPPRCHRCPQPAAS